MKRTLTKLINVLGQDSKGTSNTQNSQRLNREPRSHHQQSFPTVPQHNSQRENNPT